jgi:hypothetical protein
MDRFFMAELRPGQPISQEILERWIESTKHLSPGTRINRFCVMRQFCLYMSYFEPRTCILHRNCVPRRNRPAPHIYSPQASLYACLDSAPRPSRRRSARPDACRR